MERPAGNSFPNVAGGPEGSLGAPSLLDWRLLDWRLLGQGNFGGVTWLTAPLVELPNVPVMSAADAFAYVREHADASLWRDACTSTRSCHYLTAPPSSTERSLLPLRLGTAPPSRAMRMGSS